MERGVQVLGVVDFLATANTWTPRFIIKIARSHVWRILILSFIA